MVHKPVHILFLSTANSVRSLIAETLLRDFGGGRVRSFSAGTQPDGQMLPMVEQFLDAKGYDTAGLFSKTHKLYMEDGSPDIDLVISMSAPDENQPVLGPLGALRVHWKMPSVYSLKASSDQKTFIKAIYKQLEDSICRALQPSWDGLSVRDVQRLFEQVGPETHSSDKPHKTIIPECYIGDFSGTELALA
ncbi:arsenate-mycothiol transferase ArsC [Kiloniella spongiae]|uniref:arsenate-mycothiol transferase ArsC n=1 Tax=Kiloniella spongiae TaxID=1489064 RepID=UPI00069C61B2|nr:hypothetical protein [Kiloniella spongiae]